MKAKLSKTYIISKEELLEKFKIKGKVLFISYSLVSDELSIEVK